MTAADLRHLKVPVRAAVVVGNAARPPVVGPFDAVLGGMVAQFLPAPGRALRSWAALVPPGGRLGLSWWAGEDPRYADLGGIVARHAPTDQWQAVTDFRALEQEVNAELGRLAEPDGRLLYRPLAAFTLARTSDGSVRE